MGLDLTALAITPRSGGQPLFRPLTLSAPAGEVSTIMGPSGIGKSTLLDAIGGHLGLGFSVSGRVSLDGLDLAGLPAERRRIGVLFQDAMMFPHLSVGGNLAFGLARRVRGARARRTAVEAALDQAGLSGFYDRDPATLSGGERTRAALMRALLADPRALLMDEPFSKLDAQLRDEIRTFVVDHVRQRGIPALLVTHDAQDAEAAGGRVIRL